MERTMVATLVLSAAICLARMSRGRRVRSSLHPHSPRRIERQRPSRP